MSRKKILIPIIILTLIIIILVIVLNPSRRYQKMSISEDKWDSIIESRTYSANLTIDEIRFNDYDLVIDKDSNTIYYSLVNDSKMKYNPNVSFEASDDSAKLVILEDEITDEKVKSDYKFKMMIYNKDEYNTYDLACTDFPIVNINYNEVDGAGKKRNIPIDLYLFNNREKTPNRVTISDGKLDILDNENGSNDYKLTLFMDSIGRNRRENHVSIFDMDPHNEYLLTQAEEGGGQGPKNFKVELFINNDYKGQYSLRSNGGMQQQPPK